MPFADRCWLSAAIIHGVEVFSDRPTTPNLASLDRLAVWKELQDFHLRQADLTGDAAHRSNPFSA
ncbi:MAG: hypothetical protein DMG76_06000 [Acidobacteria bacterium]|nr:MAG: hypothetical protein DMG76_06000 [Acidobacteriota bacterium]